MSITQQAKIEMDAAGFAEEDTVAMVAIMERFFDQWDSGGAVCVMAPVLMRLIAGKCLTPLTGEEGEWTEVMDGVMQNKRVSSVFKDPRFHDGLKAYDLDNPAGPREAIEFPYFPDRAEVPSPLSAFQPNPIQGEDMMSNVESRFDHTSKAFKVMTVCLTEHSQDSEFGLASGEELFVVIEGQPVKRPGLVGPDRIVVIGSGFNATSWPILLCKVRTKHAALWEKITADMADRMIKRARNAISAISS